MDKALFSTGNTEWETPQEFFDIINRVFKFDIDVCATAKNTKCKRYFTKEIDGLTQEWKGSVWCNPPYGRNIGKWVKRGYEEGACGSTVVMLLPARTDTKWIHEYVFGRAYHIFLKGRLKFSGGGNSAPFPSMLAIWSFRDGIDTFVKVLAENLDAYVEPRSFNGGKR